MGDEVDFLPADKHKVFLKDDNINLGVRTRHAQSTKNNTFTTSLQYLK